ncbi:hypothetical protein ACS0TY_020470 [Phlomoides rotata]
MVEGDASLVVRTGERERGGDAWGRRCVERGDGRRVRKLGAGGMRRRDASGKGQRSERAGEAMVDSVASCLNGGSSEIWAWGRRCVAVRDDRCVAAGGGARRRLSCHGGDGGVVAD